MGMWQNAIDMLVEAAAVSLPLVLASGLVGRCYNALVSMVTGSREVKL